MSVLIIGAVGTSIVISLILLGIGSSKTTIVIEQSYEAKALADLCTEEALEQIRLATAFTGTASIDIGTGNCEYTIANTGGENRTIQSTGTKGTVIRKVEVSINQINPTIEIVSYKEVVDF